MPFLGGMTAARFCREHWQKKPLLVRGAFPRFKDLLSPDELAGLACDDGMQARLVQRRRGRYSLASGPFDEATFAALPGRDWTVLVQGINHVVPAAERFLTKFAFLPHARLDDLMVSYAAPGGGVGPHFDSYDVFLIQGRGHRRWQVSAQPDRTLVEGAPLRILKNFEPEQEWDLGPGDLLYLPPLYAHHGVALDECLTYSVGFRAPSARELTARFLAWLPEYVAAEGMYADPDLTPAARPAEIDDRMVGKVEQMLASIRWDRELVGRFVGQYLSDPKPHLSFEPPARPLGLDAFGRRVRERGVRLALASLMLSRGGSFFVNGEETTVKAASDRRALRGLADDRHLPAGVTMSATLLGLLHGWYTHGWIEVGSARAG
ncbi:MAG: cupin domain-containing protein [Myxococcales bacterium]|nr:MAG: cupin domain-containing protein [Myxococcales bacterium]